MTSGIDIVVYFYIFICLALMVYNILYILRSKHKKGKYVREETHWHKELEAEMQRLASQDQVSSKHQKHIEKKLKNIQQLMAYHGAVTQIRGKFSQELVQKYLDHNHLIFQVLAVAYGKREPMERAYYAYLMAQYHPNREDKDNQLGSILLSYLNGSTVYCRENVLQALYAMGQLGTIENALTLINDRGWYHNTKLLSDGLASFEGDRKSLAVHLWNRCQSWNENLQVAVVQFASMVSAPLEEQLFHALTRDTLYLETRFAIIRFFQRKHYPPVKQLLLDMILDHEGGGLAIAAAAALSRYPGEDTFQALMTVVRSRNYYVRKNAAASLAALGATQENVQELRQAGDRYAAEILEYTLKEKTTGKAVYAGAQKASEVGT